MEGHGKSYEFTRTMADNASWFKIKVYDTNVEKISLFVIGRRHVDSFPSSPPVPWHSANDLKVVRRLRLVWSS
jgi:hypothetical protein